MIITSFKDLPAPIGLFGGTFDPIQNAHIKIAEIAQRKEYIGSIVFIPAKQNPLKSHAPQASDADRVQMLSLALEGRENYHISTIELDRNPERSYTIDTVREIRKQVGKDTKLSFIGGSDIVPHLSKWKEIHNLLALLDSIVIVERKDFPKELIKTISSQFSPEEAKKIEEGFISDVLLPDSSSVIRESIQNGADVKRYLNPLVYEYITLKKLYRKFL